MVTENSEDMRTWSPSRHTVRACELVSQAEQFVSDKILPMPEVMARIELAKAHAQVAQAKLMAYAGLTR